MLKLISGDNAVLECQQSNVKFSFYNNKVAYVTPFNSNYLPVKDTSGSKSVSEIILSKQLDKQKNG